jgi:hypothetical protein
VATPKSIKNLNNKDMEFKIGDAVATPNGNGYINDIIGDQVIVDLTDGDDRREMFGKDDIAPLPE